MKKIYSICLFSLAGFVLNAQSVQVPNNHANHTLPVRAVAPGTFNSKTNHTRSTESFWMNYGVCMDSSVVGPGVSVLNQNYLLTDSTMLGNFGGTYAGVWVNHLGDILDVHATNMQSYYGYSWGNQPYSVDSMSIMYAYSRALPSNVVDTLVVCLYSNAVAANMPSYHFTGMTADYGSDSLWFKGMPYDYMTNSPTASGKVTYKILLTAADTANTFFRMKDFETNFWVPGGKLVASTVTFKPGYSYVPGDSIDNKDAFFFASYEEGGTGTFPLYQYCPYVQNQAACDWNASQAVTSDGRYNNAATWNGLFIPAYAYTVGWAFEHHLIFYKVTSLPTAVAENNSNEFSLEQNMPNPASGNTLINYSISTSAKVSLNIVDVTGKQVMAIDKGQMTAGEHSIELNTTGFAPGVYFYTLTVDGQQSTRRLVVTQ
jgi:hypothetical protein